LMPRLTYGFPGKSRSRGQASVIESPKKTTRLSPAAGGGSRALAARKWPSSAKSFMYTSVLLRRHSSRWRAAADVGRAVPGRAAPPHESTAQAASAVKVAPDMLLVIRARIVGGSRVASSVRTRAAEDHRVPPPNLVAFRVTGARPTAAAR